MNLSTASLSSITEKPSIIEDIDYICGTDATAFPLADKLRLIDKWYLKVGLWIWKVQRNWKFDDSNAASLKRATKTLDITKYNYTIPTTALSIEKLNVVNKDGDHIELEYREDFPTNEDDESAGMPRYWKLEGYSIILDRKPSVDYVTLTEGLQIIFSGQVTKFTKSDAAVSPGFVEQFHELLSKGPSFDFCIANGIYDKANVLKAEIREMQKDLEDYYSNRNTAAKLVVNPQRTNYF